MDRDRGIIVSFSEDRALKTLLRGVASDLDLEFRQISSPHDYQSMLEGSPTAVLVVGVASVTDRDLALIREIRANFGVPTILVVEAPSENTWSEAIRSGALACMDLDDALKNLVFLLETVFTDVVRTATPDRASKRWVVWVSDQVKLLVPDYRVTDGRHEICLPTIPGALLQCLASRPNEVVKFAELIRAAWGQDTDATTNALHQQIYRLRERLVEYGLSEQLQSVRGIGYRLNVPKRETDS